MFRLNQFTLGVGFSMSVWPLCFPRSLFNPENDAKCSSQPEPAQAATWKLRESDEISTLTAESTLTWMLRSGMGPIIRVIGTPHSVGLPLRFSLIA